MTAQLVLIAAILILGGVIATAGDRIGMRVGKARLRLFNLRPRQTATVVTVLTGTIISTSTFALLFALSEQLREGIFDFEETLEDLRETQENLSIARRDLNQARGQRRQVETELDEAVADLDSAQERLGQVNESLRIAIARQARTEEQLGSTQEQLGQAETNFRQAQALLRMVSQQAATLRSEIQQLQTDRQQQIAQRDQEIAQRERTIAQREREIGERDQAIAEREALLQDLESQRIFLSREVLTREQEVQGLRQGNVALLRNEPLASGVVRVVTPTAAPQAVDQLLREANRVAVQKIQPDATDLDEQVIQITNAQVEQLINQIRSGQDYVVRILSAGNYVVGEPCVLAGESCVQVFADAAPNRVVFLDGEIVAATSADPATMTDEGLVDRINLLITAAQFRARQAGILTDTIQVADGRTETVIDFFEQLQQFNQPIDIQAIAAEVTYTAGPVRIELVAAQNGQVLFSTDELESSQ